MTHFDKGVYANPHPSPGEVNTMPSMTNVAGYMTTQQQIERLLAAGELNLAWRKTTFPPDTDIPDNYVPPDYAPTELDVLDEYKLVVAGKSRAAARVQVHEKKLNPDPQPEPAEPAPAETEHEETE